MTLKRYEGEAPEDRCVRYISYAAGQLNAIMNTFNYDRDGQCESNMPDEYLWHAIRAAHHCIDHIEDAFEKILEAQRAKDTEAHNDK